jgi:amidohydrolase
MTGRLPPVDREQLVATRRDLHQHPELGFEERRTGALVAERLERLGYAVKTGVAKTGVVALRAGGGGGGGTGRCVLIRADMDGLPVDEANDVPYRSRHPGKMHACGHDGHVAIGLEVARRLHAAALPGTIKFAFQPAEEISDGAEAMVREGVLEAPTVHAAFGMHLWNDLPVGSIGLMSGPVMASVDQFEITILGKGGHAAAPHQAIDPVLIAAHVVTGLQSLVSRRRNPFEEGVVSVTQVSAGHAFNVIPGRAELRGTVRTFGGRFYEEAPQLVTDTAQGIARAFGAAAEVRYRRLSKPLVNDQHMTDLMKSVGEEIVGKTHMVDGVRTMGGEDMSVYLAKVPGAFAFVGSAPPSGKGAPHHSPTFDIDEGSLAIGAELLTRTVVRYLETTG